MYPLFFGVFGVLGLDYARADHAKWSPLRVRANVILLSFGVVGALLFLLLLIRWFGFPSHFDNPRLLVLFALFPGLPICAAAVEIRALIPHWRARHVTTSSELRNLIIVLIATPFLAGSARVIAQEAVMLWYGHDLRRAALESAAEIANGQAYCVMDHDGGSDLGKLNTRKILRRALDQALTIQGMSGSSNNPHFGIAIGFDNYWWSIRQHKFLLYQKGMFWNEPDPRCSRKTVGRL
jgi:hypothetical protein